MGATGQLVSPVKFTDRLSFIIFILLYIEITNSKGILFLTMRGVGRDASTHPIRTLFEKAFK